MVLFEVFVSFGTGSTSTVNDVFERRFGEPRFLKTTVCWSPGLIRLIVCLPFSGAGAWVIERLTGTRTSCAQPEFSTVTANARSVVVVIVFCDAVADSTWCAGSAVTE